MNKAATIVTRLSGGLGNQMFQYAAGFALARKLGAPLLVDRTVLDARPKHLDWTPRDLELDVLQCPVEIAPKKLVLELSAVRHPRFLYRQSLYRERGKVFQADLLDQEGPLMIDGYWQCERYFASIGDELRASLFVPRAAPSAKNEDLRSELTKAPYSSVHVRLGDYVGNSVSAAYHGALGPDYYERAMDELRAQGVTRFMVFSDEPAKARERIHFPVGTIFVDHNTGRDAHWDLWLMRNCQHQIIANSSFSWWGAWLNPSPNKVVIAPKNWFAGYSGPDDIVPSTWLRR